MCLKPLRYVIDISDAVLNDVERMLDMTRCPDDSGNEDWGMGLTSVI
jgi:hypothetical protein